MRMRNLLSALKEGRVRIFRTAVTVFFFFSVIGIALGTSKQEKVCLKVEGEKIEINNLASSAVVIDRDGIPDFAATSMMKSISTANGTESYNILLSGVKRNAANEIVSFDVEIDKKEYSYPNDSCTE
jgi:uncharacterized protein YabE (DUF348 family)